MSQRPHAFDRATWRLVMDEAPRSGPANMAVDEATAEACAAGESPPTLRFYRWHPPAISLGRHQPIADIDQALVAARGYDLVRRPTGGRAILHRDELTYAVVAPATEARVQGGVMDAYLRLSQGLLAGLHSLDVGADKAASHSRAGRQASPACFEVPSAYEITVGGRKLMGSAQSRRAGFVLQHGSLPLHGELTEIVDFLFLAPAVATALRRQLQEGACSLAQALGIDPESPRVGFQVVAEALCRGFSEALNLDLRPAPLTGGEIRRAAQLIRERFATTEWTNAC